MNQKSYIEAMSTPDSPSFKEAVSSEMHSIMQIHTYEITYLPQGFKILGCRWQLKTKL